MKSRFEEVVDGAWVHTSERETTTSTIVAVAERDCIVVDPAVEPHELEAIAEFVRERFLHVVFGWSTHPHWDHVLWASSLGPDIPRFATLPNVEVCAATLRVLQEEVERTCPGHEIDLCGVLTPAADAGSMWPPSCEVIEHHAHAPGHGALWFADRGLFVVGDMLSDIEIPSFDLDQSDPLSGYELALDLYSQFVDRTVVFVPGHGMPGDRTEMQRRIDLDRAYLDDLVTGKTSADCRRGAQWLREQHERQVAWSRGRYGEPPLRR